MKLSEIVKEVELNLNTAFFFTPLIYPQSRSYIFREPIEVITINGRDELKNKFKLIDDCVAGGSTLKKSQEETQISPTPLWGSSSMCVCM